MLYAVRVQFNYEEQETFADSGCVTYTRLVELEDGLSAKRVMALLKDYAESEAPAMGHPTSELVEFKPVRTLKSYADFEGIYRKATPDLKDPANQL